MKIAIVAPLAVPPQVGGAERAWDGLEAAINRETSHTAVQVKLPVDERDLAGLVDGYRRFSELDLSGYDQVITSKYPAWSLDHPNHTLLLFHPLRGLYDTYRLFGLPEREERRDYVLWRLLELVRGPAERRLLPEFFSRFATAARQLGADDPALAMPSPLGHEVVHWLDAVSLNPPEVRRHFALSRTVAERPGYFPPGVYPDVIYLPSDLPGSASTGQDYFFTCSRLDRPKRIDLLIDAVRRAKSRVPLIIAGTGPAEGELRAQAGTDSRIQFLGRVSDADLSAWYAGALATLFVPRDEDLGLVTLESQRCGTPVVTTFDAGGPTELVHSGFDGLVVSPTVDALAAALDRLAAHPDWAAELGINAKAAGDRITWKRALRQLLPPEPPTPIPPPANTEARDAAIAAAPPYAGARPFAHSSRPNGAGTAVGPPTRAVTVSTYGIWPPRGGGQLRYLHLYGAAARTLPIEIYSLVDPPYDTTTVELAPGLTETAIAASMAHKADDDLLSGSLHMPVTDIMAGRSIAKSPHYLEALEAGVEKADVVLLSHPFLLPAFDAIGCTLPMVFDAHNVEADLKRAILPDTADGRALVDYVDELERRAVREAVAIVTCSIEDAQVLSARTGRSLDDFTVIPNGTVVPPTIPSAEARRRHSQRWLGHWSAVARPAVAPRGLALFIASWHQPNIDAAHQIIAIAGQMPDVVFALVGSHGMALKGTSLPPNVVVTGMVSDQAKRTLLASADVAVNPMATGSGTNLKIVEYFASGVPTVSTRFGARGLEATGAHLLLAEVGDFRHAIDAVLSHPDAAHARAARARKLVEAGYSWPILGHRLADVLNAARLRSTVAAGATAGSPSH